MKKQSFLKDHYSSCLNFLREIKWFVVFAVGIFCFFSILGFAFPVFFEEEILNFLKDLTLRFEGLSSFETISYIFLNNLQASFFAFVLGISFGIFPVITAVINGYLVGFVARIVVEENGFFVLWRLLPHGIFELPAIFFALGIGLKIGRDLFSKKVGKKLRYNFIEGFRFFIFVILPLLLVAGIIEGLLVYFVG